VIAQAILVGVVTYFSGKYLRSIYTGVPNKLRLDGARRLDGCCRSTRTSGLLERRRRRLFCIALSFITAVIGRYSGFSYLVLYGSGILVAVVLAGIVSDQSSRLVALLELAPVRYIGAISYGLYLYHDAINLPFVDDFGPHFLHLRAVAEIALSIAIAGLSWQLIERPILSYRDRMRAPTRRCRRRDLTWPVGADL